MPSEETFYLLNKSALIVVLGKTTLIWLILTLDQNDPKINRVLPLC